MATLGWPALATSDAALCDQAASAAARKHGVPLDVLRAVALLETGRSQSGQMRPWPWALNAGGTGHWLASRTKTAAKARQILEGGNRNLDLGCFQINYRWHGQHFASVNDMLDPAQNADYAARFLLGHYRRLGDWQAAIGAYHSRNPVHAARYLARYKKIAGQVGPIAPPQPETPPDTRPQNGFALLTGSGTGARGSLVPASVLGQSRPLIQIGTTAP